MSPKYPLGSRLLWILFSDANARFNTLIEECAHLQDTIMGFVDDHDGISQIIKNTENKDQVPGFERPIACNPKSDPNYYQSSVLDRAFLSLWDMLGVMILGLHKNQETLRQNYLGVCAALTRGAEKTPVVFRFLSLRGYYITRVFEDYTSQIGHAHESLIQMLENQAGSLPNPILLRRWSSAAYGEFLAEYSRHVNWESARCVSELEKPPGSNSSNSAPESIVTHTWSHHPTSYTKLFANNLKTRNFDQSNTPEKENVSLAKFASIQSAYFYLEQPILFPLLYHECSHINFPSDDELNAPGNHRKFFGARLAAIESLRLAKFPTSSSIGNLPISVFQNYWDHYTEEVWNDVISVALCGRGYLIALALQLVGISGQGEYRHFDLTQDRVHPLDKLGTESLRAHEVPFPELRDDFLWEARLRLSCRLLQQISRARSPSSSEEDRQQDTEACHAITEMLSLWELSGDAEYRANTLSETHSDFWEYRKDLNRWVEDTVWRYLQRQVEDLVKSSDVCSTYRLTSENIHRLIEEAVNNYRDKYLSGLSPRFKSIRGCRLENVAFDVRWFLTGDLAPRLGDSCSIEHWTSNFASWMRHDGGAAFRVALEWFRVRYSLMDALADRIASSGNQKTNQFGASIWHLLEKIPTDGFLDSPEEITRWLRRRGITNSERIESLSSKAEIVLAQIDLLAEKITEPMLDCIKTDPNAPGGNPSEIPIGTITLGVVRPGEYRKPGGYSEAIKKATSAIKNAHLAQRKHAQGSQTLQTPVTGYPQTSPPMPSTVLPLLGEYQVMSYICGSTPVERDVHPGNMPRMLLKPRLTLQVGGIPLAESLLKKHRFARLTLIQFKYRWQWYGVYREIEEHLTGNEPTIKAYSLYLSSAWEDAILITWHDDEEHLWTGFKAVHLDARVHGVDMQSSYVVENGVQVEDVVPPEHCNNSEQWIDRLISWAAENRRVARVYERSGRYDYTIVWKAADENESNLEACASGLAEVPADIWSRIGGITTAFEHALYVDGDISENKKYKVITHIAVNDPPQLMQS